MQRSFTGKDTDNLSHSDQSKKGAQQQPNKTAVEWKGSSKKTSKHLGNKVMQHADLPPRNQDRPHDDEIAVRTNATAMTRGLNLQDLEDEMPDFAKSQANKTMKSQGAFSNLNKNDQKADQLTEFDRMERQERNADGADGEKAKKPHKQ